MRFGRGLDCRSRFRKSAAMCNLYASKLPHEYMRQLYNVPAKRTDLGNMPALPAIYPKYEAPIVTATAGERSLIRSQWGFLTPKKSKKTGKWLKPAAWNNTRDDKIQTAPLWRDSFAHRRCLVPATSYAEATGRNPATYHWFNVKDVDGFAFAGIWRHQAGPIGDTDIDAIVHSVVTTHANPLAEKYHHRMPVIIAPADYDAWLTGDIEDAAKLLQPFPTDRMQVIGEGEGMREEPT